MPLDHDPSNEEPLVQGLRLEYYPHLPQTLEDLSVPEKRNELYRLAGFILHVISTPRQNMPGEYKGNVKAYLARLKVACVTGDPADDPYYEYWPHFIDNCVANLEKIPPMHPAIKAGAKQDLRDATKSAVSGVVSSAAEAAAKELDKIFETKVARDEIDRLTPEEKKHIIEMAGALLKEVVAFRAASTKPLGADIPRASEDYSGFDVMNRANSPVDFRVVSKVLAAQLPQPLQEILALEIGANTVKCFDLPVKTAEKYVVIDCKFITPPHTSPVDSRPIKNRYSLVLKKGKFTSLLRLTETLQLFPFILQVAAMKLNEDAEVFFDASLAGEDGPYRTGANPTILINCLEKEKEVIRIDDSRKDIGRAFSKDVDTDEQLAALVKGAGLGKLKTESNAGKLTLHGQHAPPKNFGGYTRSK